MLPFNLKSTTPMRMDPPSPPLVPFDLSRSQAKSLASYQAKHGSDATYNSIKPYHLRRMPLYKATPRLEAVEPIDLTMTDQLDIPDLDGDVADAKMEDMDLDAGHTASKRKWGGRNRYSHVAKRSKTGESVFFKNEEVEHNPIDLDRYEMRAKYEHGPKTFSTTYTTLPDKFHITIKRAHQHADMSPTFLLSILERLQRVTSSFEILHRISRYQAINHTPPPSSFSTSDPEAEDLEYKVRRAAGLAGRAAELVKATSEIINDYYAWPDQSVDWEAAQVKVKKSGVLEVGDLKEMTGDMERALMEVDRVENDIEGAFERARMWAGVVQTLECMEMDVLRWGGTEEDLKGAVREWEGSMEGSSGGSSAGWEIGKD